MLEIEELAVSYGAVQALRDVSIQARASSITAVLGANGAGKTTLLRAITGLVRPHDGRVVFDGQDLTRLAVEDIVRKGVAHVPEGRGVIDQLTVDENLRLGGLWRHSRAGSRKTMSDIYALFPPLDSRRKQLAASLSGGERRMLSIGRALMSRPAMLVLDEPSLGLAPIITAQLMAVLAQLTRDEDLTVVLVEQNARSALSVAAWAVVLNLGQVVVADRADIVGANADLRHHYLGF